MENLVMAWSTKAWITGPGQKLTSRWIFQPHYIYIYRLINKVSLYVLIYWQNMYLPLHI